MLLRVPVATVLLAVSAATAAAQSGQRVSADSAAATSVGHGTAR
ncbi:hypothetical protein [Luteitalea sp.]